MLQCVDVGQNEITKDKAAFVIQFVKTWWHEKYLYIKR